VSPSLPEILAGLLLIGGGAFCFIAGLGILRMPDVYVRMHASTKAGTLGVGLIVAAVALIDGTPGVVTKALAVVVFLIVTAPVAAHLIGRAAWRAGVPVWRSPAGGGTAAPDRATTAGKTTRGGEDAHSGL